MRPVPMPRERRASPLRFRAILAAAEIFSFIFLFGAAAIRAQSGPEIVGRIEGDDIAVKSPVSVEVEGGRTTALLASGSEVTVRAGQARLTFADGGEIGICGPAHFSVLKSGAAVTLAFDYGRVHARLTGSGAVTIFTPLVVATPIAIGDGPREATVGLDATGAMCVNAAHGAVRVEQQLGGQSLLVPQGGEIQLAGGELRTVRGTEGACQCEILAARKELSVVASTADPALRDPKPAAPPSPPAPKAPPSEKADPPVAAETPSRSAKPGPPATEEPIYKVFMPPLTFDAASPAPPPDPDPRTIVLLRSVRVRPSVIYRGHVEPAPLPPATAAPVEVAQAPPPSNESHSAKPEPSLWARMWGAVRRTFSKTP